MNRCPASVPPRERLDHADLDSVLGKNVGARSRRLSPRAGAAILEISYYLLSRINFYGIY